MVGMSGGDLAQWLERQLGWVKVEETVCMLVHLLGWAREPLMVLVKGGKWVLVLAPLTAQKAEHSRNCYGNTMKCPNWQSQEHLHDSHYHWSQCQQ